MRSRAFTLLEILVSVAVLTILVVILGRIVTSASTVTTLGHKRMDSDSQARQLLDRMAIDLSGMIKRSDVDYYLKSNLDPQTGSGGQGKNDLIAFFSTATGYYPSPSYQSPISLVSYRIYSPSPTPTPCPDCYKMQRMGKGLLWNGVAPSPKPMLFGITAIVNNWPAATDNTAIDQDYEMIGPQIFRFEYSYLMKDGTISKLPSFLPTSNGLQDVTAISVTVAGVDPKSKVLLSDAQISTLIGRLVDFDPATHTNISDLPRVWQTALDGTTDIARPAIAGIRVYQRSFYLVPAK
jgi:prepilin-type N-terminal cleavage/methylation domain-containing protein